MPTPNLQPGAVIDGFRLEERIHQGNMSELWRVSGSDARTPMVMKIPMLREGDDPAAVVGFEVEQMIMPTLSGVHVPRFVASGDFSPLPYEEVASIGARVADALHDIHLQHVIHLDLKPSNVMFRLSGEAVLIDF